ncbi:snare-like protein [Clavulina sp. PMI_390]|nr:snare-like protein [Clavulina sp. PMI_390]
MTIYSLYIFDRHCTCVYYQDWHRVKKPRPAAEGNILPNVSKAVVVSTASDAPRTTSLLNPSSGVVVAAVDTQSSSGQPQTGLPFDEEAKLVFGVVLSLRTMIKKLSGRDENFTSYKTSAYRLHLFETLSGYKFILLSDPNIDSLRFLLRQLYSGPFVEYVARNPLVDMDSRERGIDNEHFRNATDRLIRTSSYFS